MKNKVNVKKIILIILIVLILLLIGIIKIIYRKPKIAVLCYHNICKNEEINNEAENEAWSKNVETFEQEMKFLHDNNYKTLTLKEFYDWKEGKIEIPFKSVLITFDDGLLSNYIYAFPILKKYNLNATEFTIGEFSNKEITEEWTGYLQSYMGKDLIENAKVEYPNIEFASHTNNMHYVDKLETMEKSDIEADFDNLPEYINNEYLAYPFGKFNNDFINTAREKNVKIAFVLGDNKKATREDANLLVNRINTSSNNNNNLYKFAIRLMLPY